MSIEPETLHFTTDGERVLAAYAACLQAEVYNLRIVLDRLGRQVAPEGEAAVLLEHLRSEPAVRRAPLRIHLDHMARTGSTLTEAIQQTHECGADEAAELAAGWLEVALGVEAEPYGDGWTAP